MKNHIIALSGLYDNNEYEKLGEYLRHMKDCSSLGGFGEITGNRVVDALLYQKWKMAESRNIIWECDVQIPEICCINEFDLCILFGNILDNALEACERLPGGESRCEERRFVDIQAKAVKKCFLLEVKNSADMTNKYKSGFTNKENPAEHGIGLLNVSDIVHRYNGVMKTESGDGIFVISILIPLIRNC
ncbi:MAG: ATP-binding protein [Lachnospiraceae bacterium]|nr:ATP-binding protein [Lachnospiraceae bacterium]